MPPRGLHRSTAFVWHQGGFLRESTANYLRERLAAEFGAQFQTTDLRGTWFPPGLSLGRVTFDRPGIPGLLSAREDVKISFNPYAMLFGRERLGRVVIVRPRLFVRPGADRGPAVVAAPSATTKTPERTETAAITPADTPIIPPTFAAKLRSFLRPPFPLRIFEVVDGRVEWSNGSGESVHAGGINLSVLVSSGSARTVLETGSIAIERAGRRFELGKVNADVTIEENQVTVRELVAAGGAVTGTLRGTVGFAGTLDLKGDISAHLDKIAVLASRPAAIGAGTARFQGEIAGNWRAPTGNGSLTVQDLMVEGHRWPRFRGQIASSGRRISWSRLRLPVGEGEITSAGEIDFAGGALRYRIDAEARAVDPAQFPATAESSAARVIGLAGKLHWEGSGVGAEAAGSGRSSATQFTIASWPTNRSSWKPRGRSPPAGFRSPTFELQPGRSRLAAPDRWTREEGFSGRIAGTVDDLSRLFPRGKLALGGSGRFDGEVAADSQGPRFAGSVHLANAAIGAFKGIEGSARLAFAAGVVRLADGTVAAGRAVVAASAAPSRSHQGISIS